MGSLIPWTGITSVKQELDRLFDRFGEPTGQESSALGHWAPSLDVCETQEAFVVKLSVPGIEANDIQLNLQEGVLTIKGVRKQEKESFIRSVGFPRAVDASQVTAGLNNGVLTVTLPRASTPKATNIAIKIE